jgi:hypothetical protein
MKFEHLMEFDVDLEIGQSLTIQIGDPDNLNE